MLTRKTVLVLGAGASYPYNMPTGIELSRRIVELLGQGAEAFFQDKLGIPIEKTQAFRSAFFRSSKKSVDAFLEHRPEFLEIGKAAIALALIEREQDDYLFSYSNSWLRYLYNNLNTSFEEFGKNTLSFVTFNYDRTVDHFFFESLKNTYGKPDEECIRVLKKIPIIHLHGRLGFLPWEGHPPSSSRQFNPEISTLSLRACIEQIKVIHEDVDESRDADFAQAKKLMCEADQVIFLGFGYAKTNMDRLAIRDIPQHVDVFGSAIGIGRQERQLIRDNCGNRIRLLESDDEDCLHVVRERLIWK